MLFAGGLFFIVVVVSPTAVSAHPLGNFTINRYARLEVSAGSVRIYYVLDEAEIPAFQERDEIRSNRARFLQRRVDQMARNFRVEVDGKRLTFRTTAQSLHQPPGQGDLTTLRIAAIYDAALPPGLPDQKRRLTFADRNEPDRIGWREIVAVARSDARLISSNAPARDVSDELRRYPANLVQSPLDLRQASVTFTPGSQPVAGRALPRSAPAPTRSGGAFADLITRQHLSPAVLAGMYAVAMVVGAGHAVLPGHGKTIMAAYLVGTKGRPIDAVMLGVIVSLMHTFSVLVLGLVLFKVSRTVSIEQIYPQLTVASGVVAMAFGAWLFSTRALSMRRASRSAHHREMSTQDEPSFDLRHGAPPTSEPAVVGRGVALDRSVHGAVALGIHTDHDVAHGGTPALDSALAAQVRVDGRNHVHDGHVHDGHVHDGHVHDGHVHDGHVQARDTGSAPGDDHDHDHGDDQHHDHGDDVGGHGHRHGPGGHTHALPDDVAPLSRRGLLVLAMSGGLVPSPSAVIVVVSAFSIGRVVLGLSLIAAFSIGLAVTLTAIGLALVFGRSFIDRRWPNRSLRYLPLIGAAALVLAGGVLALRGLTSIT